MKKHLRTSAPYPVKTRKGLVIIGTMVFCIVMLAGTSNRLDAKKVSIPKRIAADKAAILDDWKEPRTGTLQGVSPFQEYAGIITYSASIKLDDGTVISRLIPAEDADKTGTMMVWDCQSTERYASCDPGEVRLFSPSSKARPWDEDISDVSNYSSWITDTTVPAMFGTLFDSSYLLFFVIVGGALVAYHRRRNILAAQWADQMEQQVLAEEPAAPTPH